MLERGQVCTRLWWGNLREKLHGIPSRRRKDNIKIALAITIEMAQDREK
jgi:hypothetical protein